MTRAIAIPLLGVVAFGAVASCSASSAPVDDARVPASPRPSVAMTQPALEQAVRAYSAAYLAGHGDAAYAMLSARCQDRVAKAELRGAASAAKTRYGNDSIRSLTVDSLSGTSASVTYTYAHPVIDQTAQRWVFEGGAWRYDQC